jgi:hypothetical protein
MNVLTKKILKHIFLFWFPAYLAALGLSLALVVQFANEVVNHVLVICALISITILCIGLSFWTYERLSKDIEIAPMSIKTKTLIKGILYFLPWLMFLGTLSLPSVFGIRG